MKTNQLDNRLGVLRLGFAVSLPSFGTLNFHSTLDSSLLQMEGYQGTERHSGKGSKVIAHEPATKSQTKASSCAMALVITPDDNARQ